jgi:hypothetical protein
MKSIINIFKKIDNFNIYFKIFITNFFFSEASSVSIGCEKNSKLKQPREEDMELNPVTENTIKSRNTTRIKPQRSSYLNLSNTNLIYNKPKRPPREKDMKLKPYEQKTQLNQTTNTQQTYNTIIPLEFFGKNIDEEQYNP